MHLLKTPTLSLIEKLYKFVISSPPGELSAYKLASTLGKDFENISDYIKYLEQAGLIRFLFSTKTGKAFLRNPIKIYPENTNLVYASYLPIAGDTVKGKVRETFVINQFQNTDHRVFYSEEGDFNVNDIVFEVGGKNKTIKQIKRHKQAYVLADNILTGSKRIIPLYLLGFLY